MAQWVHQPTGCRIALRPMAQPQQVHLISSGSGPVALLWSPQLAPVDTVCAYLLLHLMLVCKCSASKLHIIIWVLEPAEHDDISGAEEAAYTLKRALRSGEARFARGTPDSATGLNGPPWCASNNQL